MKLIEPSLLAYSRDPELLTKELALLKAQNIQSIHYDVMDGIFVPNTAFEGEFIDLIKQHGMDVTVHLMVSDVQAYVGRFLKFPIKALTFQCEAIPLPTAAKILKQIKKSGVLAGIAIRPDTDLELYRSLYKKVDIITFMSVYPGKGGQAFIADSTRRVRELRNMLSKKKIIQMDGGLNDLNAFLVHKDVDWFVMGQFSYDNIEKLKVIQEQLNEG